MGNFPLLSIEHLTVFLQKKRQHYPVVDDISFSIEKGETLALVGESGCGKTMTGLAILQILPEVVSIKSGSSIIFQGDDLLTYSEKQLRFLRGKKIAMIFQDPMSALNPVYTIGNQMLEIVELHLSMEGEEAEDRIVMALSEVGIPTPKQLLSAFPHQISGGMKQRVMIAMTLLCEPDLIIADEPTTALDVTIQAQILHLLQQLQQKKGVAILLITHDMGVVAEMAHRVLIMYGGHIVEEGDVNALFSHPLHPYTKGLFASRITTSTLPGELHPIRGSVPGVTEWPQGCRFHPRCPYCMEKCRRGKVSRFLPEENHTALCWLYDGTEESAKKSDSIR